MDGLLLRDVVKAIVDCPHSTPKWESSGVYAIRNYNLVNGKVDLSNPSYVSEDEYKERVRRAIPEPGDIIISREAPIGNVGVIPKGCRCCLGQRVVLIKVDKTKYDPYYLSLVLQSPDLQHQMASSSGMGTTVCNLRIPCIEQLVVPSTVRQLQDKIVKIIGCLDSLITINQLINDNLIQQLQTVYGSYDKTDWSIRSADSVFDVGIGKTPPRKESEWFSTLEDRESIRWVSIADMGKSGMFIGETSETLTKDAVDTFNIRIVPDNTVILSFKLTVGRIAITDGQMCTNEAIAHFKSSDNRYVELLYAQLLSYNYNDLGSTSSIATAINSKSVKAMELLLPPDEQLSSIHNELYPIAQQIKSNLQETRKLTELRDYLLPKLMSGEIDVSTLEIPN